MRPRPPINAAQLVCVLQATYNLPTARLAVSLDKDFPMSAYTSNPNSLRSADLPRAGFDVMKNSKVAVPRAEREGQVAGAVVAAKVAAETPHRATMAEKAESDALLDQLEDKADEAGHAKNKHMEAKKKPHGLHGALKWLGSAKR